MTLAEQHPTCRNVSLERELLQPFEPRVTKHILRLAKIEGSYERMHDEKYEMMTVTVSYDRARQAIRDWWFSDGNMERFSLEDLDMAVGLGGDIAVRARRELLRRETSADAAPSRTATSANAENLAVFICSCGVKYRIKAELIGRRLKCAKCNKISVATQTVCESTRR